MEQIIYVKYSAERARKFAIKTEIRQDENGERRVYKHALYPEGKSHIADLNKWYKCLSEQYRAAGLEMNRCSGDGDGLELEYLIGDTLQQRIQCLSDEGDLETVKKLLEQYFSIFQCTLAEIEFQMTPQFQEVFGEITLPMGLKCQEVTDIDMIFSNIIVEGSWKLLDYEWSFDFPIPVNFILYRACFLASHEIRGCSLLNLDQLFLRLQIGKEEQSAYAAMEAKFQQYVTDSQIPERDMVKRFGRSAILFHDLEKSLQEKRIVSMQVIFCCQNGTEEKRTIPLQYIAEGNYALSAELGQETKRIKLCLPYESCIVTMEKVSINEKPKSISEWTGNGVLYAEKSFLFLSPEPWLEIPVKEQGTISLYFDINKISIQNGQQIVHELSVLGKEVLRLRQQEGLGSKLRRKAGKLAGKCIFWR